MMAFQWLKIIGKKLVASNCFLMCFNRTHHFIREACIEKTAANGLLLLGSTLALGLVEQCVLVWALELVTLKVKIIVWTQGCIAISVHTRI